MRNYVVACFKYTDQNRYECVDLPAADLEEFVITLCYAGSGIQYYDVAVGLTAGTAHSLARLATYTQNLECLRRDEEVPA